MTAILLGSANVAVFIICLIGVQACYFRGNRKWFWLLLICAILTGGCAVVEIYYWLNPPLSGGLPGLDRSSVNPL
jgi:hypothetical protein